MPPKRKRASSGVFETSSSTDRQASHRASMLQSASRRNVVSSVVDDGISDEPIVDESVLVSSYIDLGMCTEICEFCGAIFWFQERVKSVALSLRPRYNGCCKGGRVVLQYPVDPPELLIRLMATTAFKSNVRAYNAMFSMTSFGARIDESINNGSSPYVFKVSGQISHWVGSLCPENGEKPRFLQMYIYDPDNEISNRMRFFASADGDNELDEQIVSDLCRLLDSSNCYVKLFRSTRDVCVQPGIPEFGVRLFSRVSDRRYEIPSSDAVGAIISGGELSSREFDVIIHNKSNQPRRISRLHPSYMPLQYPLLFPYGEQGWSPELELTVTDDETDRNMSPSMFYSYQIHDRFGKYTHLLNAGRLYQQYLVDAYVCVEQCRLDFIRTHQHTFRCEYMSGIHDAVDRGDVEGKSIGKRIILPSSFTGSPRYMYKHYQDALALCRVYGNPQYFITLTCNAQWPEIRRQLINVGSSGSNDRPDIVARVFDMKVKSFIKYLKTKGPFGTIEAELYTIEFQKRGLPHCHLLIWVSEQYKIKEPEDVDRYITAELPDKISEPTLYRIVTERMLHGPCGLANPFSSCMKDGVCTKKFPKSFETATNFDSEGYVHYKRSSSVDAYIKNGAPLDNGFVVPYNKDLLLHFDAHINVEYCGWSMLIKYLFKYISKGAERVRFAIVENGTIEGASTSSNEPVIDEVSNYVDGRYVCPYEAAWRIFGFSIHHRNPAVQVLSVHLEGMQNITFRDGEYLSEIVENDDKNKTTLTEWLNNNTKESAAGFIGPVDGLGLRYVDYLTKYRWDKSSWHRRKTRRKPSVGRLAYVHPSCGELFYLRLLLNHQVGCCSFEDIRRVAGVTYSTYRAACERLGLIGDDLEWSSTLEEAGEWASCKELRALFAHMLLFCDVSNPLKLWQDHWRLMGDDIMYRLANSETQSSSSVSDYALQQHVLLELEQLLNSCSTSRSLTEFNLPLPNMSSIGVLTNRLILEERSYNLRSLATEHATLLASLNMEQRAIYDEIMCANATDRQLLLFIYGHGGTGKTYLWRTIIAGLRSKEQIVLAVAASGIASLLLPSGRTAHSRFKLPLDLTEESVCYVKKKTQLSQLLIETSLIIWDEAPMSDRRSFESLDRTLRDITDNSTQLFGGKYILLGGDFRQTLPVKRRATKSQIIASCLPSSYLWPYFRVYKLLENMRLSSSNLDYQNRAELEWFSTWLLGIGDGRIGLPINRRNSDSKRITIPPQFY